MASNYSLCLDSSCLGMESCVDFILRAVQEREVEK